jgi:hypothetical protein
MDGLLELKENILEQLLHDVIFGTLFLESVMKRGSSSGLPG